MNESSVWADPSLPYPRTRRSTFEMSQSLFAACMCTRQTMPLFGVFHWNPGPSWTWVQQGPFVATGNLACFATVRTGPCLRGCLTCKAQPYSWRFLRHWLKALGWADGPSLYDFYDIMHNIDPHTLMHGEFLQTWRWIIGLSTSPRLTNAWAHVFVSSATLVGSRSSRQKKWWPARLPRSDFVPPLDQSAFEVKWDFHLDCCNA